MDSDAPAPYSLTTNPFVAAMESTVTAARSLRQQMGGPSMRVAAGRAQLHQLSARERKTDTQQAAQVCSHIHFCIGAYGSVCIDIHMCIYLHVYVYLRPYKRDTFCTFVSLLHMFYMYSDPL